MPAGPRPTGAGPEDAAALVPQGESGRPVRPPGYFLISTLASTVTSFLATWSCSLSLAV